MVDLSAKIADNKLIMTHENKPVEAKKAIPVADLLKWHAAERAEIQRERARVENLRQTAALAGHDIKYDLDAARFKIAGREETLHGFTAFVMSYTSTVELPTDLPE